MEPSMAPIILFSAERGGDMKFLSTLSKKIRAARSSIDLSRYTGLIVVLSLVAIYGTFRIVSTRADSAQLRFVEFQRTALNQDSNASGQVLKDPFSGKDYEQAVRLRETSALGMAISLAVITISSTTGKFPDNTGEIGRQLVSMKLTPPGVQLIDGSYISDQSSFKVSYRREPLSFEVLAIPRSTDGTQLLFRFPIPSSGQNSIFYLEAGHNQPTPPSLAEIEQLTASGWKIRHWRGDVLPLNTEILDSLKEQEAHVKKP